MPARAFGDGADETGKVGEDFGGGLPITGVGGGVALLIVQALVEAGSGETAAANAFAPVAAEAEVRDPRDPRWR